MRYPSRTDIVTAMSNPKVSYKSNELIGGSIIHKGSRVIQYSGGFTTVFPFISSNGKKMAVRLWIADIGDAKKRSLKISEYLKHLNSKYFVNFEYLENAILINGQFYPVVIMDWIEGHTLKDYINTYISDSPKLLCLSDRFRKMVLFFHQQNIAHGDLQHGNILVKPDGELVVIDYDSMYVEPLYGMQDIIKGLPGYQHPKRRSNKLVDFRLDYFSELVIFLSILIFAKEPPLWEDYYETEDLLFSISDFEKPSFSPLINRFLNDKDAIISELTKKLVEELAVDDLKQLHPLEENLVNKLKTAKDGIFNKIDSVQNTTPMNDVIFPRIKNITDKF